MSKPIGPSRRPRRNPAVPAPFDWPIRDPVMANSTQLRTATTNNVVEESFINFFSLDRDLALAIPMGFRFRALQHPILFIRLLPFFLDG